MKRLKIKIFSVRWLLIKIWEFSFNRLIRPTTITFSLLKIELRKAIIAIRLL